MKKYFIGVVVLSGILLFTACPNESSTDVNYDPDPANVEDVLTTPDEDLYIIANIDGTIYGFNTNADPADLTSYSILAEDADTEEKYANIRISDDLRYLLYAKVNGTATDLVLKDLESDTVVFSEPDVASNESEFIDNDSIYYTDDGYLYIYNIGDSSRTLLIPHQTNRCNHWSQISPDLGRMAYKDQNPEQDDLSVHSYTEIDINDIPSGGFTEVEDILSYDGITSEVPVDLYDSFFYNWRNNDSLIFKNKPGSTNVLFEKNVDTDSVMTYAFIEVNSTEALFSKVTISPDKNTLLLNGNAGVYLIDLEVKTQMTGTIKPTVLYTSLNYDTLYSAFGVESKSIVLGTENWIGVYNVSGAEKTEISVGDVWELGTLYSLYCR